ncbi:MAG: sensor histidine kinase, partial [Candidatus Binataceae bacterium]
EVESLTEEFRRLNGHLSAARARLLREHRRQLELERTLRHSDKLATIGTLASGLAHEIGSPMAVIRGRAEYLLHSNPAPQKMSEGLGIIINQIDRISGIVHRLLDYARRREALRVPSDIRPIILRTLRLLETEAARRRVEIAAELGAVPLIADCDADQLQQVFVNLGMNALDAMTGKGGMLRVSAGVSANGHDASLRIVFEDNGPGIAAEDRSHIFDPFFTTKPPGKGTGMGLAVSQSIVQDHDGEIAMEPGITGGARFFVVLPAARQDNEPRQADL